MVRAEGSRRLLPGFGWLLLLVVLGLGAAGLLASWATADVHGKRATAEAMMAWRAQVGRIDALLAAAEAAPSPRAEAAASHLDALQRLQAGAAAPGEHPRATLLAARIAEFVHLRRELARVAVDRGADDAALLLGSEPVRLNRRSLARELETMASAADARLAQAAAALAEARQHWLSLLVGLLAGVVLLAFLQVVRLARRPVRRGADALPALIGPR